MSLQRQRALRDFIVISGLFVAVMVLMFYFLQIIFNTREAQRQDYRPPATIRALGPIGPVPSFPSEETSTEEVYYWDGGAFDAVPLDGGTLRLPSATIYGHRDGSVD
jgi:hypothetical protein